MPSKTQDDDLLLIMLARNDPEAINILYRKHHSFLFDIINSLTQNNEAAKDILQDLFVALWERRNTLKVTMPIKAYLIRAAIHRSYNFIRDNSRHQVIQATPEGLKGGRAASEPVELEELRNAIDQAVKKLSPKCKVAFLLKSKHDMTYREIAARLGISNKAVEKRISKALKHLRGSLDLYLKSLLLLILA